ALETQGYPANLALWSASGEMRDELVLESLDVPDSLLAAAVRSLPRTDSIQVTQILRTPGVHNLLLVRLTPHEVMTALVGPRSELVLPGRLGRLFDPTRRSVPLYTLSLSPSPAAQPPPPSRWRREGWVLRSDFPLMLTGTARVVHATVDLRAPVPLFVRGVLVVLLDAAALALLWFLAELVAGVRPAPPRWRSLGRSFRVRLAFTLGAFFIVPAVGFAAWSFVRLGNEVERSRDLLITQTLRDAVVAGGGAFRTETPRPDRLIRLSRRLEADLALYQGGVLTGTSNGILEDLGILGQLMDPRAFARLALEGDVEVTREGFTPELADDVSLGVRQLDLALVLLLATLAGVAAALTGAQIAARTLSRPVADLRRSALALGKGEAMPSHSERLPLEFEPVFAAFERMAADIRSSQNALEEARRRTATVLATVATGVVAVDPAGRVLIANVQAVDLLGVDLQEGEPFLDRLGSEWSPLAN